MSCQYERNLWINISSFPRLLSRRMCLTTTLLLQKGSYFLDVINNIIIRLVEAGLPDKFLNDFLHTEQHHFASKAVEYLDSGYITMTLSHLQSAFILLFLGICLSLFTFVIEILHSRRGRAGQGKLQDAG